MLGNRHCGQKPNRVINTNSVYVYRDGTNMHISLTIYIYMYICGTVCGHIKGADSSINAILNAVEIIKQLGNY